MADPVEVERDENVQGTDIKRRLLHTDTQGNSWLLAKSDSGELTVEHNVSPAHGAEGSIEATPLTDFLASRGDPQATDELLRLIGTLVDDAAAGSQTS